MANERVLENPALFCFFRLQSTSLSWNSLQKGIMEDLTVVVRATGDVVVAASVLAFLDLTGFAAASAGRAAFFLETTTFV